MKLFTVKHAVVLLLITAFVLTAFIVPASPPVVMESVVVQGTDFDQVVHLVSQFGGEIAKQYPGLNAVAAEIPTQAISLIANTKGIISVTQPYQAGLAGFADGAVDNPHVPETFYPEVVGADVVWEQGITGEGVTVAILDSGLYPYDSLLKDSQGNDRLLAWVDFVDGSATPIDPQGHGTHIAGIIANSELGWDQEANGVAPDVNLVALRILDETGFGELENILAGLDWVIQHHEEYNIKVLNLSMSANIVAPYYADPINQAVMRAWSEGITVITSAGNGGSDALSIGVPGNNPYVITVGTFTDAYTPADPSDDYMAYFSGAGPTRDGFTKPDLIAPGAHMASLMPENNNLFLAGEATQFSGNYYRMAGTSQSAAVVSGVVALMVQNNPSLTPDEIKYRLATTANPMVTDMEEAAYSIYQQGFGRVNAVEAVFSNAVGVANQHLNIEKDLANVRHYHGDVVYNNATETFLVRHAPEGSEAYLTWNGEFDAVTAGFGSWADGFGSWADGFGSWADGFGSWADGFGSWADGFGSWADGFGSWADGFGSWADGFGSWADGFGSWADGFGSWADGFGSWADGFGSWADGFGSWADGFGSWADGFGSWADGFGSWADGFGSWADGFGSWADGFGSWADGFGSWADGFGSWADGFGSWADGFGSWADGFGSWADG
ncbi:MAG: S8 family serine peptidase, partial [Anaerolineae bacterium]|nr:S8 family serine peptidase [Anaerolineae bacterium]